jgi:hypothetical protein
MSNKYDFVMLDGIPYTEKEMRMLQTCQRKTEHRILRVVWSDRVTNAEVRQRINLKDIVAVALSLKWKCAGHVARMDQRGRTQATSVWHVGIGKKRNGRPKTDGQTLSRV